MTSRPFDRYDRIDALRGVAMVWMAAFHFCFDLNHFGLWQPRQLFTHDPFWTCQRVAIVSLFLFCAGLGQAVALQRAQGWPRFWKRWLQVVGCALLVSAGSALMFPRTFIVFGVLHGIALMLIVSRLLAPLRAWLVLAGAVAVALPQLVRSPLFDPPWLNWVGLVAHKPVTEDWVPLLPWLGVMLWGLAAGQGLLAAGGARAGAHRGADDGAPSGARAGALLTGALPQPLRPLALLGRWPLTFYMLHQPLLIGALQVGRMLHWW